MTACVPVCGDKGRHGGGGGVWGAGGFRAGGHLAL